MRYTAAVSTAAIMADVDPLPLVPATWTIGIPADAVELFLSALAGCAAGAAVAVA